MAKKLITTGIFQTSYLNAMYFGRSSPPVNIFDRLSRYCIDAATVYRRTKQLPADYPLLILGQPTMHLHHGEMVYSRNPIELLACGHRLTCLSLQLQILRAEVANLVALTALKRDR